MKKYFKQLVKELYKTPQGRKNIMMLMQPEQRIDIVHDM